MRDPAQATAKENLWFDGEAGTERGRLKIWEIDNCFKCPIVGTCVTLAEQKHLLKKAGVCLKKKSPFDIHEILVVSCEAENRLSRRFDALPCRLLPGEKPRKEAQETRAHDAEFQFDCRLQSDRRKGRRELRRDLNALTSGNCSQCKCAGKAKQDESENSGLYKRKLEAIRN